MTGIPLTEKEYKESQKALHAFDNLENKKLEKPEKEKTKNKNFKPGELFV